jgi:hypothetical protein
MSEESTEYSLRILGLLYAMAAAELNGDHEAKHLLRSDLERREEEHFPEAAVAVAAAAVNAIGVAALEDPMLDTVPVGIMRALTELLRGERPGEVVLDETEDPVDCAVRTVALCWAWKTDGDSTAALEIARQHCVRMELYKMYRRAD